VLITVDTLRPDRLGYGGNPRPVSARIDRLAKEGVVFTRATSVAGWTLPAVATMFTGRLPSEHGATDFHWSLDASLPGLASILRANGYDTYGFVSHVMLTPTYGMGEGFSHFDFSVLNVGDPHEVTTAQQLPGSRTDAARKTRFLWVITSPAFQVAARAVRDVTRTSIADSEIAFTIITSMTS
jgi:arylsulfatase A-like enzyme